MKFKKHVEFRIKTKGNKEMSPLWQSLTSDQKLLGTEKQEEKEQGR